MPDSQVEKIKCDICGTPDCKANMSHVFEGLRSNGVEYVCYNCGQIINTFAEAVHEYAEQQAAYAEKQMIKRLDAVRRVEKQKSIFFFLLKLRTHFKKYVTVACSKSTWRETN